MRFVEFRKKYIIRPYYSTLSGLKSFWNAIPITVRNSTYTLFNYAFSGSMLALVTWTILTGKYVQPVYLIIDFTILLVIIEHYYRWFRKDWMFEDQPVESEPAAVSPSNDFLQKYYDSLNDLDDKN